jgi:peptidoglycan DL-endopeptidase CwlO
VLGLAVAAGFVLGVALSGAQSAGPQKRADDLHRKQTGLEARSHQALLGLYALDSRLVAARGELSRLRGKVAALRHEQDLVRRELEVVRANLQVSERLLGDRLRLLYEEGEPDAMAVLLGSTSLDDAVTRLDELERSARQGAQAAEDARDGREQLHRLSAALALRVLEAEALAARAERTAASLAGARTDRVAYLASLAGKRRLTARQIAALESQARRVTTRAQAVQAQSSPPTAQVAPGAAAGPRTITVTASGYSLPGRTSTGLPVGAGVVAVDPAVIALGTQLTIPGYGDGVAADTGSGVRGNAIDLWFPTLADALAWGRRTVTITLH